MHIALAFAALALPFAAGSVLAQHDTTAATDYAAPAGAPYTAKNVSVPTPRGYTLAGTLTLRHTRWPR